MARWKKNDGKMVLSLLAVLAVMVLIFAFSAQTGEESGETSGHIVTLVLRIFAPDFDRCTAAEQERIFYLTSFLVRKAAHFSEFCLLGITLTLFFGNLRHRLPVKRGWLWAWGIGTLYACSDEFHQSLVGGRGPSLADVGIDSSGVIAGVLLVLLCRHLLKRNREA